MSEWYEVKNPEDIELSDDGKYLDVLFAVNEGGNCYVEIPIELIRKLLDAGEAEA